MIAFSWGRRVAAARPLFDRAGEHEPLVLCEGEGDTPDVEVPPLLCQWLRPHQRVPASKERAATSWRLASMAWRWSVDATRVTVTPSAQP